MIYLAIKLLIQFFKNNKSFKNPEIVKNEHDKEIPKERYLSTEERQKITDSLIFVIIV